MEERKKIPLNAYEIILLIITIPILFYCTGKLLWEPINSHAPHWFFGIVGLLAVLGLDCFWITAMKLWPLKSLRVKIYATLFVLTISAAVLTCWFIYYMLKDMKFG